LFQQEKEECFWFMRDDRMRFYDTATKTAQSEVRILMVFLFEPRTKREIDFVFNFYSIFNILFLFYYKWAFVTYEPMHSRVR
jgi:hypothetical protein